MFVKKHELNDFEQRIITLEEYIIETGCTTSAEKFRNEYDVAAVRVTERKDGKPKTKTYEFIPTKEFEALNNNSK